jgi:hypothetical protein
MRIQNRYQRNCAFRAKHWKRIRNTEHPFRIFCPYYYNDKGTIHRDFEKQVQSHFKEIERSARALENGTHKQWVVWNASADFRRVLNKQHKARDRHIMDRIYNGNYELEFDKYHKDAAWYYF